jgi:SAM-dependent methyltransferase
MHCLARRSGYIGAMMQDAMTVFDRRQVRRHRDRAATFAADCAFLHDHVGDQLVDRLFDVVRDFPIAVELGCHAGGLGARLIGQKGVERLVSADFSPRLAGNGAGLCLAADEEWLPFAEQSVDLVMAPLSLHWTNDLPGALIQINRTLKPDGLFLGALLGGDTLFELRRAVLEVEADMLGGVSPRLSPLTEVRDAGGLLQRAGLALPVVDRETVTVTYDHPLKLIADLRGMGETCANLERRREIPPRGFWPAVAERYASLFAESDGRVPATFEVLYLSGWAPAPGQQRPLRPGSAQSRLAEALGTTERPAGDKVG